MNECNTGNLIVDEVSKLDIQGYVIPRNWYYTIVTEHGKPHYLAIAILASIVNAYQAREVRDEITGEVVGYDKKFEEDMFVFSYTKYEEQYGESHSTLKRAIIVLEKLGIIKRELDTIVVKDVRRISNVVFIQLNIEALVAVTFPEKLPKRNTEKKNKKKDVVADDNVEPNNDAGLQQAMVINEQVVLLEANSPTQHVSIQKSDAGGEIVTEDELRRLEDWLATHLDEMFVNDMSIMGFEDDFLEDDVVKADECYDITHAETHIKQEDNIGNSIHMVAKSNQNERRLEICMSFQMY